MLRYPLILALGMSQLIASPRAEAASSPFLIYFEHNSAELDGKALNLLVLAEQGRRQSRAALIVTGHTDRSGSPDHNQALSLRRAVAVKNALTRLGAPESHVFVEAYGEARTMKDTPDEARESLNRRVDLTFAPLSLIEKYILRRPN